MVKADKIQSIKMFESPLWPASKQFESVLLKLMNDVLCWTSEEYWRCSRNLGCVDFNWGLLMGPTHCNALWDCGGCFLDSQLEMNFPLRLWPQQWFNKLSLLDWSMTFSVGWVNLDWKWIFPFQTLTSTMTFSIEPQRDMENVLRASKLDFNWRLFNGVPPIVRRRWRLLLWDSQRSLGFPNWNEFSLLRRILKMFL